MNRLAILVAIFVSVVLAGGYALLGGADYAPTAAADPCMERPWTNPDGRAELARQIAISALDGAGCELGVSREELLLAFRSRNDLTTFGQRRGLSEPKVVDAARAGLARAIDDAQRNGAIGSRSGSILRRLAGILPIGALFVVLRGSSLNWG
ncbi:MAG: hypothetical protein HYX33_00990 [Actinobacteria bacterium]|nr:hypothetical protein [Actinomycetota bacterium]